LYSYFSRGNGTYNYFASINTISVAYNLPKKTGAIGINISDYISGSFVIPSSLAQLVLNGNEQGKTYSFDELNFQTWWLRAYSLSYSRELFKSENGFIKKFNAGMSFKYISGFAYTGIKKVKSSFHTSDKNVLSGYYYVEAYSSFSDDLAVKYDYDTVTHVYNLNYFTAPAGSGIGIDIGFSAELDSSLSIGLSITDIGAVNWTSNVAKHISEKQIFLDDLFKREQIDSVTDIGSTESQPIKDYQTSLPTCLRIGISLILSDYLRSIPGKLLTEFDYNQGFNSMPSNYTVPRISLGVEWMPLNSGLSILTGTSHDETFSFNWSLGIGYSGSIIEVYLSTFDIISTLSPNGTKPHASFAFNMAWKILGN
ncbi:MAG: hypothetical protein HZB41_12080, partial [Ignavibacteriae bacterium]|nr:hypothetical protein [Ignavibacteriota bacterium]